MYSIIEKILPIKLFIKILQIFIKLVPNLIIKATSKIQKNIFHAINLLLLTFASSLLFHCASPNKMNFPNEDLIARASESQRTFFFNEVKPILDRRCVVCHSCTFAPCQLHLDSYEAIRRGATYAELGSSYLNSKPTRDKDAETLSDWRKLNFFPIIPDPSNETQKTNTLNSEPSLLMEAIKLGNQFNSSGFSLEPINKARSKPAMCLSTPSAYKEFTHDNTYMGMPYGLPGLSTSQVLTLQKWMDQGAPVPIEAKNKNDYPKFSLNETETKKTRTPNSKEKNESNSVPISQIKSSSSQISQWESVLNETPKSRLMARYIYEHVFTSHIHLKGTPSDEWYELIRSSTAYPAPPRELVTRRPYDDPKESTFYYRFKPLLRTIARSSHIPWEIDEASLNHYKKTFLQVWWNESHSSKSSSAPSPELELIKDPGYKSVNPFKYFNQIPEKIRYQFMLENSQVIANAMIRGPACSGRLATHAIRDHFWVFFLKPESDVTVLNSEIALTEWTPLSELDLTAFEKPSLKYTEAMKIHKPEGFSLNDLWNGDKSNPNALLTILRHGTNASVHQGLLGGIPHTLWVLNYSNFERIYYNLVADFEPWSNSAHKASTWNYMSRHRSEAEERFISFLPESHREGVRIQWTQGVGSATNIEQSQYSKGVKTQVVLKNPHAPVKDLIQLFQAQYTPSQIDPLLLGNSKGVKKNTQITNKSKSLMDWEKHFNQLSLEGHLNVSKYFPDVVYLKIENQVYTILNHRFYKFNNILALEKLAYEPKLNKLYLIDGLIGDYPEFFLDLKINQINDFLISLQSIKNAKEWLKFKETYFVRRNNPKVWVLSDWFIDWLAKNKPSDAGITDMRQYDIESDSDILKE